MSPQAYVSQRRTQLACHQQLRTPSQIIDEPLVLAFPRLIVLLAQHVGGVDCHDHAAAVLIGQDLAAPLADRHGAAEHAARRGRPHGDDHLGLDDRALKIEPPAAGVDLAGVRLLVQPPLAALLELEMLDCAGDEHRLAVDAGLDDGAVEDAAGRADERMALLVFLIARLLADQHDPRVLRPFARHDLRGGAIERAARAGGFGIAQRREASNPRRLFHDRAIVRGANGSEAYAPSVFRSRAAMPHGSAISRKLHSPIGTNAVAGMALASQSAPLTIGTTTAHE